MGAEGKNTAQCALGITGSDNDLESGHGRSTRTP